MRQLPSECPLGPHKPPGSTSHSSQFCHILSAQRGQAPGNLRAHLRDQLVQVVKVPGPHGHDPEANRIEWLWRALRAAVTHKHQRQTLAELLDDARV
jgi:hypothetical protein